LTSIPVVLSVEVIVSVGALLPYQSRTTEPP